MTCNFVGGALGSALAGTLWNAHGWALLMACATALMIFSLLLCLFFRQTLTVDACR